MNYLAHAYLSFNHQEILVGNMISDFVKGNKKFSYSPGIINGIELHRLIDGFTDDHSSTREAKKIFSPYYGLYSGAFVDVAYDYFLANDKNEFIDEHALYDFSQNTYTSLEVQEPVFPERFRVMFPYMKKYNWLFGYREKTGIMRSFEGLVHRAAYLSDHETAFRLFEEHLPELREHYSWFFPELKSFVLGRINRADV
jgi:acyl carrier protein phosphodiesterase